MNQELEKIYTYFIRLKERRKSQAAFTSGGEQQMIAVARAFRDWGYELSMNSYNGELLDGGPWVTVKNPNTNKNIIVKDVICDAFLQQILTRPKEYDVIATYQVPVEVKAKRAQALALRWLIDASRKRKDKNMSDKIFNEIFDAYQNRGSAIKSLIFLL